MSSVKRDTSRLGLLLLLLVLGANANLAEWTNPGCVTWSVPQSRVYFVELYGAAGGTGRNHGNPYPGGKGGKVTAALTLTAGTVLRICVGGQGTDGSTCSAPGGTNGGGKGAHDTDWSNEPCAYHSGGGGGGASDVRIGASGGLSDRIIVAGGGGGGSDVYSGGDGGGTTGGAPSCSGCTTGGSTFSGGSPNGELGDGGDAVTGSNQAGGGGGGGWYGGGGGNGGSSSYYGPGGGGSSYAHPSYATNVQHSSGVQNGNGRVVILGERLICTSCTPVS